MTHTHLCNTPHLGTMREFYSAMSMYPTSDVGDVALVRSHIAYWAGEAMAQRCSIRRSRGHSLRVAPHGEHGKGDIIVRIVDHFDHRNGVVGFTR